MPPTEPLDLSSAHGPRRRLLDWLAAMHCVWYPLDLPPDLKRRLDPRAVLAAQCRVGRQTVLLQHDLASRPACVRVICVLGPLPAREPVPLLLHLLQANLLIALRGHGAVLGLDGSTDAVCLSDELSLAEDAEARFRLNLLHLASLGERWREGRLLADAWP